MVAVGLVVPVPIAPVLVESVAGDSVAPGGLALGIEVRPVLDAPTVPVGDKSLTEAEFGAVSDTFIPEVAVPVTGTPGVVSVAVVSGMGVPEAAVEMVFGAPAVVESDGPGMIAVVESDGPGKIETGAVSVGLAVSVEIGIGRPGELTTL